MTAPRKLCVILRPQAEADIVDAAVWYDTQRPLLGQEFLDEIDISIATAAENPFRFPRLRRHPEVRRALTRRFPYRVFFIRRDDAIIVFRVLHGPRSDDEWQTTLPLQ